MEQDAVSKDLSSYNLLRWYLAAGVDELAGTAPLNRFDEQSAAEGKAASPLAPAPRNAPAGRLASPGKIREEATAIASACLSLAELEAAVRAFDGSALKATATTTVFSDGDPLSRVMFIGDAPGAEEDRQGRPFVGESGQLLDKMLAAIGRSRQQIYATNILFWRPPGSQKPTPQQSTVFMPFVKRHIELVQPKLLVLLGGTPANLLLDTPEGITRLRGKWTSYTFGPGDHDTVPVLPTYHPLNLLQQPHFKADAWKDFLEIRLRLETLKI
jgi:DNA polymerase